MTLGRKSPGSSSFHASSFQAPADHPSRWRQTSADHGPHLLASSSKNWRSFFRARPVSKSSTCSSASSKSSFSSLFLRLDALPGSWRGGSCAGSCVESLTEGSTADAGAEGGANSLSVAKKPYLREGSFYYDADADAIRNKYPPFSGDGTKNYGSMDDAEAGAAFGTVKRKCPSVNDRLNHSWHRSSKLKRERLESLRSKHKRFHSCVKFDLQRSQSDTSKTTFHHLQHPVHNTDFSRPNFDSTSGGDNSNNNQDILNVLKSLEASVRQNQEIIANMAANSFGRGLNRKDTRYSKVPISPSGCFTPTRPKPIDKRGMSIREDGKVTVHVKLNFLKIGEIQTLKEVYNAEIYVQLRWREPELDQMDPDADPTSVDFKSLWNPHITIDNIVGEPKEKKWMIVGKNDQNEAYVVERKTIKGVFAETLELADFPFDVQDLSVTLTTERSDAEVEIVEDEEDLCSINIQSTVEQQEWRLYNHVETTKLKINHEYAKTRYSRPALTVMCRAARRYGFHMWNVFLIMFFITILAFTTFSVEFTRPQNRLQLSFTLLLTSVSFKFVVNHFLPRISYLTYLDKYILFSMGTLCFVCIWHAIVSYLRDPVIEKFLYVANASSSSSSSASSAPGDMDKIFHHMIVFQSEDESYKGLRKSVLEEVMNWDTMALISLITIYFMFHVIFFSVVFVTACRRRRIMKKKDRHFSELRRQLAQQKAVSRNGSAISLLDLARKENHTVSL